MAPKDFWISLRELGLRNPWRTVFSVLLLADVVFLIGGLLQPTSWGTSCWILKGNPPKYEIDVVGTLHVILWTIGPPAWFFIEAFVLMKPYLPSSEGYPATAAAKVKYERWKLEMDMAKAFWAAVLAAILFCIPKA